MRLFSALRATVLFVCAAAAASHADGLPSGVAGDDGRSVRPHGMVCNCPSQSYRPAARRQRYRHIRAEHFGVWPPAAAFVPAAPLDSYNPLLPDTYDSAYDRAMVLHFRSPAVTDTYIAEPGFPPTPPVAGVFPYRVRAWNTIYQYDGMIGQYVALARSDAAHILPASVGGW